MTDEMGAKLVKAIEGIDWSLKEIAEELQTLNERLTSNADADATRGRDDAERDTDGDGDDLDPLDGLPDFGDPEPPEVA